MQPVWQTCERHFPVSVAFFPTIPLTGRMNRGWCNYAATVTTQVYAGLNVGSVVHLSAWMREIHMTSATASNRLRLSNWSSASGKRRFDFAISNCRCFLILPFNEPNGRFGSIAAQPIRLSSCSCRVITSASSMSTSSNVAFSKHVDWMVQMRSPSATS